jgi:hypothetical protein
MAIEIKLDFSKETSSRSVLDILGNGLRDDPKSKLSFVDCLLTLSQGKKLQYGAANHLLSGIVRALHVENSSPKDEFVPGERIEDADLDPTLSQIMANASSQKNDDAIQGSSTGASTSEMDKSEVTDRNKVNSAKQVSRPEAPKKKELCRFYARGHCTRSKECRFDHPAICNKFKKYGSVSSDPRGCDGKCKSFHPNACRSSLQHKSCSFQECRFFHLKGTKRNNNSNPNTNQGSSRDSNWRSNQDRTSANNQDKQRNQGQNWSRSNVESKNSFASLNQKSKNRNPKPGPPKEKTGTETQKGKELLGQTLEAIMRRLTAMESRHVPYLQPIYQPQQVQPNLSPAVPPPGTQTQFQWGSQPQWTQSQTQY